MTPPSCYEFVPPLTYCQLSQYFLLSLFGPKFYPGTHVAFSCHTLDFLFSLQQFLILSLFLMSMPVLKYMGLSFSMLNFDMVFFDHSL